MQEVLNVFQTTYPPHQATFQNSTFNYYIGGNGNRTLLLLPGILGTNEILFPYFIELTKSYKVIMPIYPNLYTIKELLQSINFILKKEKIDTLTLVGCGFGGIVAQCFVRNRPKKVEQMILIHSNSISDDFPEAAFHSRIVYLAKMIKFTDFMPLSITKSSYKKTFKKIGNALSTDKVFWKNHLIKLADSYTKSHMNASLGRLFDFTSNYKLTSSDLKTWQGTSLIIEDTYDDPYTTLEREILHKLYSSSQIVTIPGLGSINILEHSPKYLEAITQFLETENFLDKPIAL